MLNALRQSKQIKTHAARTYAGIVARSREPFFFVTLAVPDSFDGRFDLLTLHAYLVLSRLKEEGRTKLAQALVDRLFTAFDEALRELGAGDIAMGRRMKQMADAFYGRLAAYEAATDPATMGEALVRNLYRGELPACIGAVADYVLAAKQILKVSPDGGVDFGPLPGSP
ncbi:cytochrome b pre-mRNA-processing protein 3 [Rhizomicrobium palustre]|uniref:Cytochrome b pre-mRNA-processing protein 3 n=1 Tax=Rhizomicrobium palustre TaxID=189966 RepID=A0A846N1H4_9PROT|nr:ubiquinol-cytochrome C chaperone family protein [Rhizomicrobium palustre]NIK89788.1 cytochrome b pre-mRNA-processing protein 3 [Rhizomicrobium palustre]